MHLVIQFTKFPHIYIYIEVLPLAVVVVVVFSVVLVLNIALKTEIMLSFTIKILTPYLHTKLTLTFEKRPLFNLLFDLILYVPVNIPRLNK